MSGAAKLGQRANEARPLCVPDFFNFFQNFAPWFPEKDVEEAGTDAGYMGSVLIFLTFP